ncbi:serine hydrolase domain-containing protein [Sphingomonas sp. HT-1]|uniref:serine hydrolase domain-containing protein n=1 Tax=unclassified Sphingomonas TaxID=196159 RepID=UPI000AF6B9B1|nr:serine hydrolase [Sphingomonas sp. ATCC 31555]
MAGRMAGTTIPDARKRRFHRALRRGCLTACTAILAASAAGAAPAPPSACPVLREAPRAQHDPRFTALDETVRSGVGSLYAGAVLLVARDGQVVHRAAFGDAQRLASKPGGELQALATPRAMTVDTLFDMASITKVEATTAAILHLVGTGRLSLDARLGTLLPAFDGTDKATITVRQLLTHRAGLWEWQPTWLHRDESGSVLPYLAALPLRYPIGARFAYSDLGFMLLGAIVVQVGGMPLERYVAHALYRPMGMRQTGFLPRPEQRRRAAATSAGDAYQRRMAETGKPYPAAPYPPAQPFSGYRTNMLVGEANDANAALGWGGVAGHAGLFSTATDLARYAQLLMNGGCHGRWRLAPAKTIAAFLQTPFDLDQALGFHKTELAGIAAPFYGHSGFTGTWFAFSPSLGLSVVLLTNRVHRPEGEPYPALGKLQEAVLRGAVAAVARNDPGDRREHAWR